MNERNVNMKKRIITVFLTVFLILSIVSCGTDENVTSDDDNTSNESQKELTYEQITAEEAKAIIDSGEDYIIIDSRTDAEYAQGHIEGAIMIPEYEIAMRAEEELPDKNALILVYCRSGRRSKIAASQLVKLGYTNVKEFGGIIDWPYETVK